jgi:hypothetical protein
LPLPINLHQTPSQKTSALGATQPTMRLSVQINLIRRDLHSQPAPPLPFRHAHCNFYLVDDFSERAFDLIKTELDLASTFLKLAKTVRRKLVVKRNIKNARTAYQAAIKLMAKARLPATEKKSIKNQIAALKAEFKSLRAPPRP